MKSRLTLSLAVALALVATFLVNENGAKRTSAWLAGVAELERDKLSIADTPRSESKPTGVSGSATGSKVKPVPSGLRNPALIPASAHDPTVGARPSRVTADEVKRQLGLPATQIRQAHTTAKPSSETLSLSLVDGRDTKIDLVRIVTNPSGSVTLFGAPRNETNGSAVLILSDAGITGTIRSADGTYSIAPVPRSVGRYSTISETTDELACGLEGHENSESSVLAATEFPPQTAIDAALVGEIDSMIDVLVVYTPAVLAYYDNNLQRLLDVLDLVQAETNIALPDRVRVRIVGASAAASYQESASVATERNRIRATSDGFLDDIHGARTQVGADIVSFWVLNSDPDVAGISYFPNSTAGSPELGFFAMRVNAGNPLGSLFAHELGHNLAAQHDSYVGSGTVLFDDARGYVEPSFEWRTIMAYWRQCNDNGASCPRILAFSNPAALWTDGRELGVLTPQETNNGGVVSAMAPVVDSYRARVTADDSYEENDEFATGFALAENVDLASISGSAVALDRDCYRVQVPVGREWLVAHSRFDQALGLLDFRILDSSGITVGGRSADLNGLICAGDGCVTSFGAILPPGDFAICVDPIDSFGNQYSLSYNLTAPPSAPDLAARDVSVSRTRIHSGEDLAVQVVVENLGDATASAGSSQVRLYRANHPEPDSWPGGDELGTLQMPSPVGVGDSVELSFTVADWQSFPNLHWIGICVDPVVLELPTALENNCATGVALEQPQPAGACQTWVWGEDDNQPIVDDGLSRWPIRTSADDGVEIADVELTIEGAHGDFGALEISLVAPNGQSVLLSGNRCPTMSGGFFLDFDDESPDPLVTATCPLSGFSYQPEESLASLAGTAANGAWQLEIVETPGVSSGVIDGVVLSLCTSAVVTTSGFEPTTECANGRDDDLDGYIDFPADPNCTSATDLSEVPEPSFEFGLAVGALQFFALARRRQLRTRRCA